MDDLSARCTDNADFFAISEPDLLSTRADEDDVLFDRYPNKHPDWLQRARAQRLLVP